MRKLIVNEFISLDGVLAAIGSTTSTTGVVLANYQPERSGDR